jgi:citrate lyase alpha subunit
MGIAVDYSREKFKDAKQSVLKDGTVNIGDNQITYLIDPATIVTGQIDNDANEDAIVTIASYKGKFPFKTEHLILIKANRKFTLARVIEADIKIMEIKEMIIFAEISKFPPDSPSYGCEICKEIVKYEYRDGNLVRTE